jgi:hypothetical protein
LTDLCGYCEKGIQLKRNIKNLKIQYSIQELSDDDLEEYFENKNLDAEYTNEMKNGILNQLIGK